MAEGWGMQPLELESSAGDNYSESTNPSAVRGNNV